VFLQSWYKFYCVLARSRYKLDRSLEFIPRYKFGGGHWRSVAVQFISKPVIYPGAGFILRAGARVRVQVLAGFVMGAGCRKNHDKPINYTVRVSNWAIFFRSYIQSI
jgi:hypothetical protein